MMNPAKGGAEHPRGEGGAPACDGPPARPDVGGRAAGERLPGRPAVEAVVDHFEELLQRLGFLHAELPAGSAGSAASAISCLVHALVVAGTLPPEQAEDCVRRVLDRERLGSTAIGEGVALPHATTPAVTSVVGVGARGETGIAWGARDGEPVRRICLILAPPAQPGPYLRVLEALSQGLRQKNP